MKNLILFFLLFLSKGAIHSQNNVIDKSLIIPKDIEFNGSVKKIIVKKLTINKNATNKDSLKGIAEVYFTKKGNIKTLKICNDLKTNFFSIVEFDNLNRIKKILHERDNNSTTFVEQFFRKTNEFADSTLIFRENNNIEKYINHFKRNLIIKEEHFYNNKLQDYRTYKYNNQNQLIEDLYSNPEIDTDETVVFKENYEISVYPERLTLYEHKKENDTIITIKIRPKSSIKEVIKNIKTNKFTLEINEKYKDESLKSTRTIYTSKDSISNISIHFKKNREIERYYKTFITPNKELIVWTNGISNNEKENTDVTHINIVFDKFKNWTKKIYSKNNLIIKILEREIEYYN